MNFSKTIRKIPASNNMSNQVIITRLFSYIKKPQFERSILELLFFIFHVSNFFDC